MYYVFVNKIAQHYRHRVQEKKTEYKFSDDAVILMTCISHTTAYKICVRFISMVYICLH